MVHDAMQCYQTAIKLRPDFAIAYGNLASCYYDCGWVGGRAGGWLIIIRPGALDRR